MVFFPTFEKLDEEVDNQLEEKGIILKSLILRKLEFQDKIHMLKDLIRITNEKLWNNNRALIRGISKELDKIREFRNLLAHSPMNTSKEYRDYLTSYANSHGNLDNCDLQILVYEKGEVNKHNIDEGEVRTEVERVRVTWHKLMQLFALLKNDLEDARACEAFANAKPDEIDKVMKQMGLKQ